MTDYFKVFHPALYHLFHTSYITDGDTLNSWIQLKSSLTWPGRSSSSGTPVSQRHRPTNRIACLKMICLSEGRALSVLLHYTEKKKNGKLYAYIVPAVYIFPWFDWIKNIMEWLSAKWKAVSLFKRFKFIYIQAMRLVGTDIMKVIIYFVFMPLWRIFSTLLTSSKGQRTQPKHTSTSTSPLYQKAVVGDCCSMVLCQEHESP